MEPLPPPNPLVARAIQRDAFPTVKQLIGLLSGVTIGSFIIFFGLYAFYPTALTGAIGVALLYLLILPIIVSWQSARFTEKTIHGGFYDLMFSDLSDRDIVLGHMLIGLFWVREWLTVALALILPLIFITPAWFIAQNWSCTEAALGCNSSDKIYFLLPIHLLVGILGLNLFASALGVAISLRWRNQNLVWIGAVMGILSMNILWAVGFYISADAINTLKATKINDFENQLFLATLASTFLLIYILTLRQKNPFAVGAKILASAFVFLFALLLKLVNTMLLLVIMLAIWGMIIFGIIRVDAIELYRDQHKEKSSNPSEHYLAIRYGQVELAFISLVALVGFVWFLLNLLANDNPASWGMGGIVGLMMLPYLLGLGTMLIAEHWTERPLDSPTESELN